MFDSRVDTGSVPAEIEMTDSTDSAFIQTGFVSTQPTLFFCEFI